MIFSYFFRFSISHHFVCYQLDLSEIKDLRSKFWDVDYDGDEVLNKSEFVTFCRNVSKVHGTMSTKQIEMMFHQIDRDKSECLDFEEVVDWFCKSHDIGKYSVHIKKLQKTFFVNISQQNWKKTTKNVTHHNFTSQIIIYL